MDRERTAELSAPSRVSVGAFRIDLVRRELLDAADRPIELRQQALDVLLVLAENVGHRVSKAELMARVWPNVVVTEDSLVQAVGDIRRALGDAGHRLLRTLPRHGYMLVPEHGATVAAAAGPASPPGVPPQAAEPKPVTAAVAMPWRWIGAALLAATVSIVAWLAWPGARRESSPQVAVLAFRDRHGTPDGALLARGLAEDVVLQLGRNQGLAVIAQHSSFAASGKDTPAVELGRQLNAQYLVDGVVERNGERLRIEVELIDARNAKVAWTSMHESDGGAVVQARDEIVRRVAGTLFSKLRESERTQAAVAPPKSLDVYALTQRGLALKQRFSADATRQARAGLERALQIDPDYAPAWAVLGWVNSIDAQLRLTGEWTPARAEEALAQTRRAIELDPSYPLAYSALASTCTLLGRFEEAAAASARAVELTPGDAEARLVHAYRLLPARPPEQALSAMSTAVDLYPIPPPYFDAMRSMVLWANRQEEAALRAAEACTRRAPGFRDCRIVQALVHAERGRNEQAREQIVALGAQAADFGAAKACRLYAGSPVNVERCRRLAETAGLAP